MQRSGAASRRFRQGQLPVIDRDPRTRTRRAALRRAAAPPAAPAAPAAPAQRRQRTPWRRSSVYAFYYAWYQSPAVDGRWAHWNHEHLPHWDAAVRRRYPPFTHDPDRNDVGAAFFPRLGVLERRRRGHRRPLRPDGRGARRRRRRVLVPAGQARPERAGSTAWSAASGAAPRGLALCLHLEPWEGRTAAAQLADVAYAVERYGGHAAYHRVDGRPAFFAYDSYQIAAADWRAARRAADDGAWLVGLVLDAAQLDAYVGNGGFDAAYSYFGAARFTQASTPDRWPALVAAAARRGGSFVPCVSPGYDDTRVRPWNGANARSRDGGAYYDDEWRRGDARAASP
ncbi:glycoprotein endo-alpha-1,2-mannosidase-like protein [Aureococcus anophagefferens]|nr:glycoprotein endo-alpha-1,2-mannosidase-like protein [Aureococcus anophagefferens]